MAYVFLDESGDLGFDFSKKKTSNYFVITFLFVKNKNPIEKIVKKIFRGLTKNELKFHPSVLHCYKERPKIRTRLLTILSAKDCSVITIYLNKKRVYTKLQNEKQVLYNYVTNILLDRVCTKKLIPTNEPILLVASRRETNKFLNENFKNYLESQVQNHHKIKIDVCIKSPHEEKCLQVVDFVCWSVFRKYQHGDDSYYNLIKQKIVEENPLYP